MRVLHAYKVYRPDVDGGIAEAIALASSAVDPDVTSQILVARGKRGWARSYPNDVVPNRAVGSLGNLLGMPLAPSFPIALAAAVRQADVVALHVPFPLNDIGIIGMPSRVGLVVHWHAEIIGRRLIARSLEPLMRQTLARADKIIVSDDALIAPSRLLSPHAHKCEIVPFGVDVAEWSHLDSAQEKLSEELRQQHPRLIVALGRLVTYKGFDVLIRAMTATDGHLVLIGTGSEYERLTAVAANAGVADRVTFAGYLSHDDVKIYLRAARVFAFSSVTNAETFGISQLEAMAAGLPIVNTALPTAVPRVARDGHEAITVPPGDVAALASAITRLLDDQALAADLGAAGQARAMQFFDHAVFTRRVQSIYSDVFDMRRHR